MSNITSFENTDENIAKPDAPAAAPEAPKQELAPQSTETGVAEYNDFDCENDGFAGEADVRHIRFPRLQIVHGVGELIKAGWTVGSFVLNGAVALAEPKKGETYIRPEDGVAFYLLGGLGGGLPTWMEIITDAEFKAGKKARIFKNEREAIALGFKTGKEWRALNNPAAPKYGPALTVKVLIEATKELEGNPNFPIINEATGKSYALASLTFAKGAYWSAGKDLVSHISGCQMMNKAIPGNKYPLYNTLFKLHNKLETPKGSTNAVWTPAVKAVSKTSPEMLDWVKQFV